MTLSGEFVEAYADSLPPLLIGLLITVVGGVIIGVSVGLVGVLNGLLCHYLLFFKLHQFLLLYLC